MKNISLTKVTVIVAITALASSLVSAKDVLPQNMPAIATTATTNIWFEQLDSDKNNLLSLVETEDSKLVRDVFTTIDSNSDATISKDEFATYITK
ncbi:MAG: EF-hand domain-containing protein [Colwellia sp.]|nr:EF-hand domain-containing protein [Colwellia sp.]